MNTRKTSAAPNVVPRKPSAALGSAAGSAPPIDQRARRAATPQRRKPTAGRPAVQKTLFDLEQGGAR